MKYSKGLKFISNGDGTCYVGGIGKCRGKNIVIPPVSPNGDLVTRIGEDAFYAYTALKSVIIPDSVTSIGSHAFHYCKALANVTIGKGVTSIENFAFWMSTSLTRINLPDSVTSIGDWAFRDCALTSASGNYKAFFPKNGKIYAHQGHTKYCIGKKRKCDGELILCENGLHYCTNMFDIFNYYYGEYGKDFVIAECEVSDENIGHTEDSKRCARWIRPIRLLTMEEVIDKMNQH